jgi:hypothetical protein
MDSNGTNASQLHSNPILRSQGPLHPLDLTHLNPANCYVRSYDCNQRCNVNASFNAVGLQIREKRKKLVTEIAALLGHFSGHWYEPKARPRGLPWHPLDWSSTLLQQLCELARSLPCDITAEQRLVVAHKAMSKANKRRKTLGSDTGVHSVEQKLVIAHEATSSVNGCPNTLGSDTEVRSAEHVRVEDSSTTEERFRTSDQDIEVERLETENQRLLDVVHAMGEEAQAFVEETVKSKQDQKTALDQANAALLACKKDLEQMTEANAWLERDKAVAGLARMGVVVSGYQQDMGFR